MICWYCKTPLTVKINFPQDIVTIGEHVKATQVTEIKCHYCRAEYSMDIYLDKHPVGGVKGTVNKPHP